MADTIVRCPYCGSLKAEGKPCAGCKKIAKRGKTDKEKCTEQYIKHHGEVHNQHQRWEDEQ